MSFCILYCKSFMFSVMIIMTYWGDKCQLIMNTLSLTVVSQSKNGSESGEGESGRLKSVVYSWVGSAEKPDWASETLSFDRIFPCGEDIILCLDVRNNTSLLLLLLLLWMLDSWLRTEMNRMHYRAVERQRSVERSPVAEVLRVWWSTQWGGWGTGLFRQVVL